MGAFHSLTRRIVRFTLRQSRQSGQGESFLDVAVNSVVFVRVDNYDRYLGAELSSFVLRYSSVCAYYFGLGIAIYVGHGNVLP